LRSAIGGFTMRIAYFHASKYGNGAMVAEELARRVQSCLPSNDAPTPPSTRTRGVRFRHKIRNDTRITGEGNADWRIPTAPLAVILWLIFAV
jgi:hypothetical protein